MFARVQEPTDSSTSNWSVLQYKYMVAYLDFFSDKPTQAATIAEQFKEYPVPKWASKFQEVLSQVGESQTGSPSAASAATTGKADVETGEGEAAKRAKRMDALASTEPALSMAVEAKSIVLTYANLTRVSLRFYPMDIELLFSNSPFLTSGSGGSSVGEFAYIRPYRVVEVALPPSEGVTVEHAVPLPDEFNAMNVMLEAAVDGLKCSQVCGARVHCVAATRSCVVWCKSCPLCSAGVLLQQLACDGDGQLRPGEGDCRGHGAAPVARVCEVLLTPLSRRQRPVLQGRVHGPAWSLRLLVHQYGRAVPRGALRPADCQRGQGCCCS